MIAKKPRTAVLYARVSKEDLAWIASEMKRLGYKSKAEFVTMMLGEMRKVRVVDDRIPKSIRKMRN